MRSLAVELAIVLGFTLVAVAMTWPFLAKARTHIVDFGVDDTLLYARYARCFRDWLIGREPGYLSFDMYFPSLLAGATNDSGLGIAVQALPLSLFVRDWLFLVNLVTFASFVMCAHATYLLTREITRSRGAGVVAGLAFAFCFYRMRQLDHANVLQMQWLPYALYFMCRLAARPSWPRTIVFALFSFFAFTASFNVAIYGALTFPIIGAWILFAYRDKRGAFVGRLLAAAALDAVPLYFAYRPYLILRDVGAPIRQAWEIKMFSSHVESFHAAPAFSTLYGDLSHNMSDESATFLGWSVLALAAVGAFGLFPDQPRRLVSSRWQWMMVPVGVARAAALAAGLVLLAFFALIDPWAKLLFLGGAGAFAVVVLLRRVLHPSRKIPSIAGVLVTLALFYSAACFGLEIRDHTSVLGPGIWPLMRKIPGFEEVRTPARLFFVTSFCVAILAGMGALRIADTFRHSWLRWCVFALCSAAALYELRCVPLPLRRMPTIADAPPVYRALAKAPEPGAVLELPIEWSQHGRLPVYYANIHQRPEVNGISSWGTYYFNVFEGGYWKKLDATGLATMALDALRAEHIAGLRFVVLHRGSGMTDSDRDIFVAGITSEGGHPFGSYGTDELWELPDPPPSRAAVPGDLELTLRDVAWTERHNREMLVTFDFVNRTGDALYEGEKPKHFSLKAASAGVTVGEGNVYLLPLLFSPHGDFPGSYRMKLASLHHPDWVTLTITDDDGKVWGTTQAHLPD